MSDLDLVKTRDKKHFQKISIEPGSVLEETSTDIDNGSDKDSGNKGANATSSENKANVATAVVAQAKDAINKKGNESSYKKKEVSTNAAASNEDKNDSKMNADASEKEVNKQTAPRNNGTNDDTINVA